MKQIMSILSLMLLILPTLSGQVICHTGVNKYREVDTYLLMVEISLENKEAELQLAGKEISLSLADPFTSKEKKYLEEAVIASSKQFGKEDLKQFEQMFNQLRLKRQNDVKHQNDLLAIEMLIRILNDREK